MEINLEVLYIIIGIIYFIYSVVKNFSRKPVTRQDEIPQEGHEEEGEEAPQRPHRRETVSKPFDERVGRPVSKPSSFEELLEEFDKKSIDSRHQEKAKEKVKKVREVDEEYQPVDGSPDQNFTEEQAEKRIRETEARKALQEKTSAVERAEVIDKELSRKIKEDIRVDVNPLAAPEERKRSGVAQQANKRRQQILLMLKNPDNVTNTIIASEILRRKHF